MNRRSSSRNACVSSDPRTNSRTAGVQPRPLPEILPVERVREEAGVEDEVGVEGDAVLVAEADDRDLEPGLPVLEEALGR